MEVGQTLLMSGQQCRYVLGGSTAKPPPQLAGLVMLASAPPAGNGSLVGRTMRKRPLFSIRLTWSALKLPTVSLKDGLVALATSEKVTMLSCGLLPQCDAKLHQSMWWFP